MKSATPTAKTPAKLSATGALNVAPAPVCLLPLALVVVLELLLPELEVLVGALPA